ncbi:hypothetical protein GIB67_019734, partial [Kingdonia uniflora]
VGRIWRIVCPLVAVGLIQGCNQVAFVVLFEILIVISGLAVMFFPYKMIGNALN